MVSQIIISKEDSTSFYSIGTVQDDATLVSALGGALASFAIEMGLSESDTTQANYSRFQNGILISKWLQIGNHRPSLMIALRDFENIEQYQQMFLIDYGANLARKIISTFEKYYTGEGQVPSLKEGLRFIPIVANEMYKDSPNTLKDFITGMDAFATSLLDDMWENQGELSTEQKFTSRSFVYQPNKINQIKDEFIEYYYREGVYSDALFPLKFAAAPDFSLVERFVLDYLKKKSQQAVTDIKSDISKIVNQLQAMSSSRSRRGKQDVESVDLINADIIFEKISLIDSKSFEKDRKGLLDELFKELLQKLYQNCPLKFLACYNNPITIDEIQTSFEKAIKPILSNISTDPTRVSKRISAILRDVTAVYTPEEALKNRELILERVQEKFISVIKKEDPFIVLIDSELKDLKKLAMQFAQESFEQYKTAHDEAMALWYVLRQINQTISKLKTINITNQMKAYLIQKLVRKYQFRPIPKIVYALTKSILNDFVPTSSKKSDPVLTLLQRNLQTFEKSSSIKIPEDIKKNILKRIKVTQTSQQSFENIEAIAYFSQAFSEALESTIVKILELFLGSKERPQPPQIITESIEKVVVTSQSIYSLSYILNTLIDQPGAKILFSRDAEKILIDALKFDSILPSIQELAIIAYERGWFVEKGSLKDSHITFVQKNFNPNTVKVDISKLPVSKFLTQEILIPEQDLEGKISELIKEPIIVVKLYSLFAEIAFTKRRSALQEYIKKLDSNSNKKKSANDLKNAKLLFKAINQLISGGSAFQRILFGKKNLRKITSESVDKQFSVLNCNPHMLFDYKTDSTIINHKIEADNPLFGNYTKLMEVYASTWVRESTYVKRLKEEILWGILEKNSKNLPLEKKIIRNMQTAAAKDERIDQETIVRNTIEQEVSLTFNNMIRESIAAVFEVIKDDMTVRMDPRTKDFYIKIDSIDLDKKYLQNLFDNMSYAQCMKSSDDKSEIRLNISQLLPMINTRKKKAQTMRAYIRDGVKDVLRLQHMKAFNSLGELVEIYIGEQAADLFFTKRRILEQLILEAID
ncbi:MAG: hypothetical protein FK734_00235 [Asgard group archaeon]|nr:hypothetical protein [Asgard group archaeon]